MHKLNYALPLPHGRWLLSRLALREKYLADELRNVKIDYGLKMDLKPSDNWTDMRVYFNLKEPHIKRAISKYVKEGDTLIDVGAHIGYFSLLMAYFGGPSCRLYSFEPNPEVFTRLVQNVRNNTYNERVITVSAALSDEMGTKTFFVDDAGSNLGTFKPANDRKGKWLEIDVTTLDNIISEYSLSNVSFMKLDVEGAELSVLRGGKEFFKKNRPVIVCEVSSRQYKLFGHTVQDLQKWAMQNKYALSFLGGFQEQHVPNSNPTYSLQDAILVPLDEM